jgi:hypothetical protein
MRAHRTYLSMTLSLITFSTAVPARASDADSRGFSFAVVADPRGHEETWKNALTEIRDMKVNPPPRFAPARLVVVVGDMDPADRRYADFKEVFSVAGRRPLFLPVIGNHDLKDDSEHFPYIRDLIIPSIPGAVRRHAASCDYYLDHGNTRLIAIDAYTDLGKKGVIHARGREWAERVITSAPATIEHIFICFHEPAFPRHRHLYSSFNAGPRERDAFWKMLVAHRDRVRAVFVSHDHRYYRMRVKNPSGAAASDASTFPDEEGGIYQVDVGATGMDWVSTIVVVQVDGKNLTFRVIQAANGKNKPFSVKDEWRLSTGQSSSAVDRGSISM